MDERQTKIPKTKLSSLSFLSSNRSLHRFSARLCCRSTSGRQLSRIHESVGLFLEESTSRLVHGARCDERIEDVFTFNAELEEFGHFS